MLFLKHRYKMRNIVLRKLSSLAVLVAVSLGFASCGLLDDESMPYKELEIPNIVPGMIDAESPEGQEYLANYDDVCTIINSMDDARRYFSEEELASCPEISKVDYKRNSVVIYTVYVGGSTYGYIIDEWKHDKDEDVYMLKLRFNIYSGVPGYRYLLQAAFRTDKIDDDAKIAVEWGLS